MSTTDAAAPAVPVSALDDTADELLARIRGLQPLIERNAAQGEQERRVVEESITALTRAGAFKVAQPRRYGGYQASVRTMLDVSAAVAEADGGTGWVVALCNVCAWLTGLFSAQAQDEVWALALGGQYPIGPTDETLYRSAFIPVLALVLTGPQLGMARKALDLVTRKAPAKPISYTFYAAQADSTAFQLQLAQAALMIDTAHLHAYRAADDIDQAAQHGRYPDLLQRARVRADTGWAVEHLTKAIDLLLSAHGAASFAQANPLQRIWRDSAVAARHAIGLPVAPAAPADAPAPSSCAVCGEYHRKGNTMTLHVRKPPPVGRSAGLRRRPRRGAPAT